MRMPAAGDTTVGMTVDSGSGGQPQRRGQLTIDRVTGAVAKWEPFSSSSPAIRRLRARV